MQSCGTQDFTKLRICLPNPGYHRNPSCPSERTKIWPVASAGLKAWISKLQKLCLSLVWSWTWFSNWIDVINQKFANFFTRPNGLKIWGFVGQRVLVTLLCSAVVAWKQPQATCKQIVVAIKNNKTIYKNIPIKHSQKQTTGPIWPMGASWFADLCCRLLAARDLLLFE